MIRTALYSPGATGESNMKLSKFKQLHRRLNGSAVEYNLHKYHEQLAEIKIWAEIFTEQDEFQLRDAAKGLKNKARSGVSTDTILPEVFGLVFEISRRVLNLTPFDEQLIAGIAMHEGKLVQMQTGEGKTLTAVFPACLHGLMGRGMHILTFNDYLACRDAAWMETIYNFMGLSVGVVQERMEAKERRNAYGSDITYLTAREDGFDYLRDCLVMESCETVQRDFHFAIIDEADSILIDEARIPLVIATASPDLADDSRTVSQMVKTMRKDNDFVFDDYVRNVYLTEKGLRFAEEQVDCGDLYEEKNLDLLTSVNLALHAEFLLHKDSDYIVRNGKVELVDEFTGRVADRRRWPDGIQAAIEAKENLAIQAKGRVLNTITIQHFLQHYSRISGMTATACPAEDEFRRFYGLDVVVIPPHKPCIRQDQPDRLFKTRSLKNLAIVEEIKKAHSRHQPVLAGTGSVAESESLANTLRAQGIECEVLNARQDADEANIIRKAGRPGAVTISTNMAGRGVDIQLGCGNDREKEEVSNLGGLYIIGTNKHASPRIDHQLIGRSGRQGDPGQSCFFISLEDDLFVKYNLDDLLPSDISLDAPDGRINSSEVLDRIDQLQRIIEGQNLEIKKTLCLYSDLVEHQRMLLLGKRKAWLKRDAGLEFFKRHAPESLRKRLDVGNRDTVSVVCRRILLLSVDQAWSQYLAEISNLRESIHLVRFAGQEPIMEFRKQAVAMFERIESDIEKTAIEVFHRIKTENGMIDMAQAGLKGPSSTWTYFVNDDPFELAMNFGMVGNIGMAIAFGAKGPLLKLISRIKKFRQCW